MRTSTTFTPALVNLLLMVGLSQAVNAPITVYSTVIFSRMGERTPVLNLPNETVQLTSYGAQQMYDMGAWYRARYLTETALGNTPLFQMPVNTMEVAPVNVLTSYMPEAMTSALAFMQAFYPPIPVEEEEGGSDSLSANGSIIYPPGGWQYPLVESFTPNDPYSIFISGADNCLNGDVLRNNWLASQQSKIIYNETMALYQTIGGNFIPSRIGFDDMNFYNAWQIYDAIDYLNRHDEVVQAAFGPGGEFYGDLGWLADLAADQMWEFYGQYNSSQSIYYNYLTTAGSTLAGAVYMYFNQMLSTNGAEQKLNLIVADFPPIISMLALMGMGKVTSQYMVLPSYATSIVFELFTYDDPDIVTEMPSPEAMFVRFYYRNGTAPGDASTFVALPMFGNGPSQTDMSWTEFSTAIANIAFIDPIDWCNVCDAAQVQAWCQGYMTWIGETQTPGQQIPKKKSISPVVAGVIGALVTLVVAGLIFAAGAILGGFRITKRGSSPSFNGPSFGGGAIGGLFKSRKTDLGGFKGSAKMASDADLNLPKNGAPIGIGATIEDKDIEAKRPRGHERVGSWELKGGKDLDAFGHQRFASVGSTIVGAGEDVGRSSFDDDNFISPVPTRPRESF